LAFALDERFAEIAKEHGVKYSRYADDLYFSSSQPGILPVACKEVIDIITSTRSPRLAINKRKTYHASRKRRMLVTGLRITPDAKISVGRDLKRKIRVLAHKAMTKKIGMEELSWLTGMLAYVSSIEPRYAEQIRIKYNMN
jgi:RNA-directed DNA polymerase